MMLTKSKKKVFSLVALLAVLAAAFSPFAATPVRAVDDDFVIVVKTDNSGTSSNTQFTIPTYPGETYLYDVDCDHDGTDDIIGATGDATCTYGSAGTYLIRIKDNSAPGNGFPRIYFNDGGDKEKLLSIMQWGTGAWSSMESAFEGCINLTIPAADTPNLSNVINMSRMFANATGFNSDINGWDTSNVTNMSRMFYWASSFNGDISGWDTGNVTNMSWMFHYALNFNQDIGGWNTSKVTNMERLFISAFDFNQDISGWDTSNVTNMSHMFTHAISFNQDISGWDTSNVTTMYDMFNNARAFNQDIGGWDTSNVTIMIQTFYEANAFDQDLGGWNVTAVTRADSMFGNISLSTTNYDALLIGWGAQNVRSGVPFNGGNSTYCLGEDARQHMISNETWSISDGGKDCSGVVFMPLIVK